MYHEHTKGHSTSWCQLHSKFAVAQKRDLAPAVPAHCLMPPPPLAVHHNDLKDRTSTTYNHTRSST